MLTKDWTQKWPFFLVWNRSGTRYLNRSQNRQATLSALPIVTGIFGILTHVENPMEIIWTMSRRPLRWRWSRLSFFLLRVLRPDLPSPQTV